MTTPPLRIPHALLLGLAGTLVLAAGCAGLKRSDPFGETVHNRRVKRDAEVARSLDAQRDAAEFQTALARWNQQDAKGCRDELQRLLARNPKHREAQLLMADVLLADGQSQKALARVQETLRAYPDDPDVQYAVGLLLDTAGQNSEALAYYEQASEAAPANEIYAMTYRMARDAARQRAGSSAAKPLAPLPDDKTITAGPDAAKPAAPAEAAKSLQASPAAAAAIPKPVAPRPPQAPQVDGPQATVEKAGKADPAGRAGSAKKPPLMEQGYTALAEHSPATALAYFRQAASHDPDNPQILIDAATAALRAQQPRLAVDLLAPAAARLTKSAAVHRVLGVAYYRVGDFPSSQLALQQALSLDKSSALSYFLMGCTLAKLGQLDEADAHFRQAQVLDARYAVRR